MDNEEIQGVKFSQFPSETPGNADEVVGLHAGDNARFSIANIIAAIRQGLAKLFVPASSVGVADGVASLDSTGKVPSSQLPPISSDAADITYDPTSSGSSATNVQVALDEAFDDLDGKQAEITASGILKGDGQGGVSAATPGTDYQSPLTAGTDYATPPQLADKANQAQLAYVETGTTASRAYSAGEYFCWNGLLYRATSAISSGGTFTPGTNCETTNGGGFNQLLHDKAGSTFLGYIISGTTRKITFVSSTRFILAAPGTASTRSGLWYGVGTATGVYIYPIGTIGSALSLNTSANTITVANSSSTNTGVYFLDLSNTDGWTYQ